MSSLIFTLGSQSLKLGRIIMIAKVKRKRTVIKKNIPQVMDWTGRDKG